MTAPLSRRSLLTGAAGTGAWGLATLAGATPAAALRVDEPIDARLLRNPRGAKWQKPRFPGDPGVGYVYFGAVIDVSTTVTAFESKVGRTLGSRRNFHQADSPRSLIARAREDVQSRRFSVLSIKPPGSWREVAEGVHNGWLDEILEGLGALDAPMAFTIHHEPEDDADAADNAPQWHKAMTEFVHARADRLAPKVNVIQILMQYTFRPGNGRNPRDWLAPSVRLFGLDAYNFWYPGGNVEWISFREMVSRAQDWAGGKPIVIGEFGVHTDPNRPRRAVKWMNRAFDFASSHDVVAMNYFNVKSGPRPFALDSLRSGAYERCLHDGRSVRLRDRSR